MANLSKKLSKEEVAKFFYTLCIAIAETKDPQEAASFLRDLLSFQEAEMIAKRLKIAQMLLEENTYEEIREKVKASYGTIARIQEWLKVSGDGFREAVVKTKGKEIKINKEYPTIDTHTMKKRYPMYYWPQIVLENIIKNADYQQRQKLKRVLVQMDKMKEKTELYRQLKEIIKKQ